MNCCSKRCINIVTLIIAVIIFIQTNFLTIIVFNLKSNSVQASANTINTNSKEDNSSYANTDEEWKLLIPKINVTAFIKEGTSGEIINNYIGHFEETAEENGNIGLIAASAGYKENYFADLKELAEGDVIIYVKGNTRKEYKVTTNVIIAQTDWSYLSSTSDNRLTLITGILEEPEKRRCVQAIEVI